MYKINIPLKKQREYVQQGNQVQALYIGYLNASEADLEAKEKAFVEAWKAFCNEVIEKPDPALLDPLNLTTEKVAEVLRGFFASAFIMPA